MVVCARAARARIHVRPAGVLAALLPLLSLVRGTCWTESSLLLLLLPQQHGGLIFLGTNYPGSDAELRLLPAPQEAPGPRGAGQLRLLPIWGHCLSLPEGRPLPASHCPLAVSCWPKPWPASSLFISLLVAAPGRTQEAGEGPGSRLALLQPWSPWSVRPGLFPAWSVSLTRAHGVCVEGAARWAGPRLHWQPLALAETPEKKWGGEGHSCLPFPLQNSPSLYDSGPDEKELESSAIIQGWGLSLLGQI